MSQNSSNDPLPASPKKPWRVWMLIGLPLWVYVGFMIAQYVVEACLLLLDYFHVPLSMINKNIELTILSAFIYIISIAIVIGLPWLIAKRRTTRVEIGLSRLPQWLDFLYAPVGVIVYFTLSAILTTLAVAILPWFDVGQVQDTGFSLLNKNYEYVLAFLTLVLIAPIAEEILFRGYLFGKLRKAVPLWLAILVTSALFGFIHGAWNIGVDTFALSIVLCLLRVVTKSLWAPILLHMIKNGIAFYLLFINPLLLHTLGG